MLQPVTLNTTNPEFKEVKFLHIAAGHATPSLKIAGFPNTGTLYKVTFALTFIKSKSELSTNALVGPKSTEVLRMLVTLGKAIEDKNLIFPCEELNTELASVPFKLPDISLIQLELGLPTLIVVKLIVTLEAGGNTIACPEPLTKK